MPAGRSARAGGKATKAAASGKQEGSEQPSDPQSNGGPQYFLIKSEPDEYSVDMLASKPAATDRWDGIRNFRARNLLKTMKTGDQLFFYHSSCKVPGIVGIVELAKEAYPDPLAFDPASKYHDPKSNEADPRWFSVDVRLVRQLKRQITLHELKSHSEGALKGMMLFNVARLSVQVVTPREWEFILSLEDQEAPEPAEAGKKVAAGGKGAAAQRGGAKGSKGAVKGAKKGGDKAAGESDAEEGGQDTGSPMEKKAAAGGKGGRRAAKVVKGGAEGAVKEEPEAAAGASAPAGSKRSASKSAAARSRRPQEEPAAADSKAEDGDGAAAAGEAGQAATRKRRKQ